MRAAAVLTLVGLLVLTFAIPLSIAGHGGHHMGTTPGFACNSAGTTCSSGEAKMAFATGCGQPPGPPEDYVCLDLSGSAEGYSAAPDPETDIAANGGKLSAGLSDMDSGGCNWLGAGGCVHTFMDGFSPVHKAWHKTDGIKYIHGGHADACPGNCVPAPAAQCAAYAEFNAWYKYF